MAGSEIQSWETLLEGQRTHSTDKETEGQRVVTWPGSSKE